MYFGHAEVRNIYGLYKHCRKWFKRQQNLQQRDLVLVVKDNEIRSCWPVVRVLDIYPGQDGVVRSAKVKSKNDEMIGPSRKLSLLECAD